MANTPEGKEHSRLNALKHGLRATDDIFIASLPQQDKTIFDDIRDSVHEENHPQSEQEKQLVDRIAIQIFRQFRLYKLENLATIAKVDDQSPDNPVLYHLDRLSRYDARIAKQLRQLHNQLCMLYMQRDDFSIKFISNKD
ncbi:hypothetical protein KKH18_12215 [bacterium]|nr:hypothetical protein [bacterium]